MHTTILSTKLKRPQPRRNYIRRESLFHKLETIAEHKLTVIQGAAGSGKTTLFTSYIQETELMPFAWINLDEKCNQQLVFWNYIMEALRTYTGESGAAYSQHFNSNFHREDTEVLLSVFMNILSEAVEKQKDFFLILDDFHLLTDQELLHNLEFFFENIPPQLHIILLTRHHPSIYLSSFEMNGELLRISDQDFALTEAEAISFLQHTLHLPYDTDTLLYITQIAEGWIGGLQLIAAATNGKKEEEIRSLDLSNRIIKDYLTKEIFDQLSPDEQYFTIITAFLPWFNKDIAVQLIPDLHYEQTLECLMEKNIMFQCIDETAGQYRYHHIMEEYLRTRFAALPEEEKHRLCCLASDYFISIDEAAEGLNLLLGIQEYKQFMEIYLQLSVDTPLLELLKRIPIAAAAANLDFIIQRFFYCYITFDTQGCLEAHEAIEQQALADSRYRVLNGVKVLFSDEAMEFDVKLHTIEELEAIDMMPTTKALVMIKNSVFLYYNNKLNEALDALDHAQTYTASGYAPYIDYFLYTLRSQIYEELGYFNQSLHYHLQTELHLKKTKAVQRLYLSHYVSITGIYLKQMRLEKAQEALNYCKEYIQGKDGQIRISYDYNVAEYLFLSGDIPNAVPIIESLMQEELYTDITLIAPLILYLHRSGNLRPEIRARFIHTYENVSTYHNFNKDLLYIRFLIEDKKWKEALTLLDPLLFAGRKDKIYLRLVEAALVKIRLLLDMQGTVDTVYHLYIEALHYACDNHICQPFYVDADITRKMLSYYGKELSKDLPEKEVQFHTVIQKLCGESGQSLLSERETEVLKALASGLTNKEIGEELCISLATVKTHILNIYRKLEVNSRVAAVEYGRTYGLI